jgi:hypothetical protein
MDNNQMLLASESVTHSIVKLNSTINEKFQNKIYDLIVHFKGFDRLFADGVYNGRNPAKNVNSNVNSNVNYSEDDKTKHIQEIADEYIKEIKNNLNNPNLNGKKLLLVWDGDGLEEFQWTQVMIATANKLKNTGSDIEFLCCYKTKYGKYGHEPDFTNGLNLLGIVHKFTYEELGVSGYEEVGMVLLYVTSNLINRVKNLNLDNNNKTNYNPILVLCAGGGETPLNEYMFTQNMTYFTIDGEIVTPAEKHPLAMKLVDHMIPVTFNWFTSHTVHSRKNKKKYGGVETSAIKTKLDSRVRRNFAIGGARKKRTKKKKASKKSKSLKKSLKKKSNKSKRR